MSVTADEIRRHAPVLERMVELLSSGPPLSFTVIANGRLPGCPDA